MRTYASVSALAVMGVLTTLPPQAAADCGPTTITQVQWVPACESIVSEEIQALANCIGVGPYLYIYGNCFSFPIVTNVSVGINENGDEESKPILMQDDHFLEVDLGGGATGTVPATDDFLSGCTTAH